MSIVRIVIAMAVVGLVAGVGRRAWADDASHLLIAQRALEGLEQDPSVFDGKQIPPGADISTVKNVFERVRSQLAIFDRNWDGISAAGQGGADAKEAKAKAEALRAWNTALAAALDAYAKDAPNRQRKGEVCDAFWQNIDWKFTFRTWQTFKGNVVGLVNVGDVTGTVKALDKLKAICSSPDYADAATACPIARDDGGPKATIAELCTMPAKKTELLIAGVMDVLKSAEAAVPKPVTVEDFKKGEGWMVVGEFEYDRDLNFTDEAKKKALVTVQPLFDAAGVSVPADAPLLVKLKANAEATRVAVEATAASWTTPGGACSGYVCEVARKDLVGMHPKAKLVKTTLKDHYEIHKNEVGVPTDRTKDGYLLYQLPGEKWCQLRSFTFMENYAGGGNYTHASDVTLNYVRVQQCR